MSLPPLTYLTVLAELQGVPCWMDNANCTLHIGIGTIVLPSNEPSFGYINPFRLNAATRAIRIAQSRN